MNYFLVGPRVAPEKLVSPGRLAPFPSHFMQGPDGGRMARTKSNEIASKIFEAEKLRLRSFRQQPEFQKDLKHLEQIAKRLPLLPRIPASELSPKNWRLPARTQNKFVEWRKVADAFFQAWGFHPYRNRDGTVRLFAPSPVSADIWLSDRTAMWHLNERYFSSGDVQALRRYYGAFFKKRRNPIIVERRVNLNVMERRAAALELKAKGKSPREIAKKIYSKRYKELVGKTIELKKLPVGEARERFRKLAGQYAAQGLNWNTADNKAAKELGLDIRSEAAKAKPLTDRTRHLLKSRQK